MAQNILEQILDKRVIAIVRGISCKKIEALAEAMAKGGVTCIEVTFDQSSREGQENTLAAIKKLTEAYKNSLCVGAGTVINTEQVHQAVEAGAEYIISPDVNKEVIEETKRIGKISIPGALTPTEIVQAYGYGADIVKIFPVGILGADYIKSLKGPLKHIPLMAVGGVSVDNCREFLKAGALGIGVGGNLVSPKLVEESRFDEITKIAEAYMKAVNQKE